MPEVASRSEYRLVLQERGRGRVTQQTQRRSQQGSRITPDVSASTFKAKERRPRQWL